MCDYATSPDVAKAREVIGGYAKAQSPNILYAARVPLKEQLEKTHADVSERSQRVQRAHDIITRHPEFEEFLELQELINRGLYR